MKNKKGFTLIELLAVIIILAILLVIAVPKILNVIERATANAWENSTALVKHAIEVNTQAPDPSTGTYKYTVKGLCNNETSTDQDVTNNIKNIAKVGDMNIKCKKDTDYIFTLTGTDKFDGRISTISCDASGKCSIDSITNNGSSNSESNGSSSEQGGSGTNALYYYGTSLSTETVELGDHITTLNPEWPYYLRQEIATNKIDICGIFPNGTVCVENNSAGRASDFEDCSGRSTYNGTGETCIKGYAKQKADEMLSKGATACSIDHYYYDFEPYYVYCYKPSGISFLIENTGFVSCHNDTIKCLTNHEGVIGCDKNRSNGYASDPWVNSCSIDKDGDVYCD